jgi:hypothetical protein
MANKSKKRSVSKADLTPVARESIAKAHGRTTAASEFNPDYGYVRKDLTRIGILAGSFFVILVVLSFFLR